LKTSDYVAKRILHRTDTIVAFCQPFPPVESVWVVRLWKLKKFNYHSTVRQVLITVQLALLQIKGNWPLVGHLPKKFSSHWKFQRLLHSSLLKREKET